MRRGRRQLVRRHQMPGCSPVGRRGPRSRLHRVPPMQTSRERSRHDPAGTGPRPDRQMPGYRCPRCDRCLGGPQPRHSDTRTSSAIPLRSVQSTTPRSRSLRASQPSPQTPRQRSAAHLRGGRSGRRLPPGRHESAGRCPRCRRSQGAAPQCRSAPRTPSATARLRPPSSLTQVPQPAQRPKRDDSDALRREPSWVSEVHLRQSTASARKLSGAFVVVESDGLVGND